MERPQVSSGRTLESRVGRQDYHDRSAGASFPRPRLPTRYEVQYYLSHSLTVCSPPSCPPLTFLSSFFLIYLSDCV
jgi:hypothetical protein